MAIKIDIALTDEQRAALESTDPRAWFTPIEFANARSPLHPHHAWLEANNELKQRLVGDWIARVAPRRRVFDAFCANGAFSVLAAQAGATVVTGVDFAADRVEVANLVASMSPWSLSFERGDVYETAAREETYDVVLALGGLYHVADPPYVLRQLRAVTGEWLLLQTSSVVPVPFNHASFKVRGDRTGEGLSSIRGGSGVWHYSVPCLRQLLAHGGFEIVHERRPPIRLRRRFPWWCALAKPLAV